MNEPVLPPRPDLSDEERAAVWERAVGDFRKNMLSERLDAATRKSDAKKHPTTALSAFLSRVGLAGPCGR